MPATEGTSMKQMTPSASKAKLASNMTRFC